MLRSRYVGALAPLLLALSACGSAEPDAAPPPKVSASPTPTPSTPPAPVMPEAAKADTKAGAVAFVKWYVELLNHASSTGETAPLREGAAKCASCTNAIQTIDQIYQESGHIEGGDLTFVSVTAEPRPDIGGWIVLATVSASQQRVFLSGQEPQDHAPARAAMNFLVATNGHAPELIEWTRG